MTIGNMVGYPQRQFSFRRSYLGRVSVSGILGLPVMMGDTWHFIAPVLPNEDYWLVWRPGFLNWTSNMWTMDYVLAEYYHTFTGDPTHYPVDYSMTFFPQTATAPASILNVPFGVSTPPNHFALAPAPPGYWRPD